MILCLVLLCVHTEVSPPKYRLLVIQPLVEGYLEWPNLAFLSFLLENKVNPLSHFIKSEFIIRQRIVHGTADIQKKTFHLVLKCGRFASILFTGGLSPTFRQRLTHVQGLKKYMKAERSAKWKRQTKRKEGMQANHQSRGLQSPQGKSRALFQNVDTKLLFTLRRTQTRRSILLSKAPLRFAETSFYETFKVATIPQYCKKGRRHTQCI